MPSQYPGGQAPYPSQVFLLLFLYFIQFNQIMPKKGTTPLLTLEISMKQRRWFITVTEDSNLCFW